MYRGSFDPKPGLPVYDRDRLERRMEARPEQALKALLREIRPDPESQKKLLEFAAPSPVSEQELTLAKIDMVQLVKPHDFHSLDLRPVYYANAGPNSSASGASKASKALSCCCCFRKPDAN